MRLAPVDRGILGDEFVLQAFLEFSQLAKLPACFMREPLVRRQPGNVDDQHSDADPYREIPVPGFLHEEAKRSRASRI